jgi:hypothetical protein
MMSINPDAHSIPELDHMHRGVEMARKGGLPANRALNAMKLSEITQLAAPFIEAAPAPARRARQQIPSSTTAR